MKNKRVTLREEYMKERKRIERFIKSKEKQGYEFDYELPAIPKRITRKSVERLQKVKPKNLYSKGSWVDYSTGEIIKATQHLTDVRREAQLNSRKNKQRQMENAMREYREFIEKRSIEVAERERKRQERERERQERKNSEQKNAMPYEHFLDVIIENFMLEFSHYPREFAPRIIPWLENLISTHGKQAVAQMLQEGAENGLIVTSKIAYSFELTTEFMSDMLQYLPNPDNLLPSNSEFAEVMEGMEDGWTI